jgi:hypothetical protein
VTALSMLQCQMSFLETQVPGLVDSPLHTVPSFQSASQFFRGMPYPNPNLPYGCD